MKSYDALWSEKPYVQLQQVPVACLQAEMADTETTHGGARAEQSGIKVFSLFSVTATSQGGNLLLIAIYFVS